MKKQKKRINKALRYFKFYKNELKAVKYFITVKDGATSSLFGVLSQGQNAFN
jgi:hypothetical protein